MGDHKSRIEKLEGQLQSYSKAFVWVDLFDNRVRIDVNHMRGEEITFDSVRECVNWTEKQIAQFEKVTGVACIEDVSELVHPPFRAMWKEVYKDMPGGYAVVIGLNKLEGWSISEAMLLVWLKSALRVPANKGWRKDVFERIEALKQSLGNEIDGEWEEEDQETE